ncbi:uncharacterized protein Eint_020920 [Encephalitozoon intestinalis ATCC 50506]|uniref:Uncharacterized protein n=1 Tax=Encephalitozoon intestinalis (strain ATCC 50506) TaxID=876142 RepID=E0S5V5_ENCIT|nr:uncharacterized protein Eint_020920 [Encephalitozoon intestinalis ATCC 50506]ADM11090.1 hypothetical protein Eint_020920 [Encephalitozoon intestinalis ATCC 50506]UTX44744.1 trafficking protein particle complex subunit BET3 [Encephalitozoon intestinalis]
MSREDGQKVNHDVFGLMYTSFINKVIKDGPEGSRERLFTIGKRIGERMADDFFFTGKPEKPMGLGEVSKDISESFFPYYFSFHPTHNQGIISLGRLPLLQYTGKEEECLEMICGILQSVYGYVSKDGIRFEAMKYKGEHCIVVRDGEHVEGPSAVRLREGEFREI